MGILIKGMDMPKNCRYCDFTHCTRFGQKMCTLLNEATSIKHKLPDCPLVEVPTHHGDLIDRGDVLEEINRIFPCHSDEYEWAYTTVEQADTIIESEEL